MGGTTEASELARVVADAGIAAVYSYAGRTARPATQPIETRVGGFGGVDGLARYLQAERITHLIDATHPFAAQMSRNAILACAKAGVRHIALERAPWSPVSGDDWRHASDIDNAVAALPEARTRIFLAIGRQHLTAFAARPHHHYLVRLIDAPREPLPLPDAKAVLARGPFTLDGDLALLRDHAIALVVAKNAGGEGARTKLAAARILGLPVIMIDRPHQPERHVAQSILEVMRWLGHPACLDE